MKPSMVSGIMALLLAGYVGYRGIQVPVQQQVRRLQDQLAKERATQDMRVKLARSYDEFERLRKNLSPESSTEWLLREITKRAEEQGIQVDSIAPQDRRQAHDTAQLAVNLRIRASYHQLGRFLDSLERTTPYIWVEDVQVDRDENNGLPKIRLIVTSMYVPSLKSAVPATPAHP